MYLIYCEHQYSLQSATSVTIFPSYWLKLLENYGKVIVWGLGYGESWVTVMVSYCWNSGHQLQGINCKFTEKQNLVSISQIFDHHMQTSCTHTSTLWKNMMKNFFLEVILRFNESNCYFDFCGKCCTHKRKILIVLPDVNLDFWLNHKNLEYLLYSWSRVFWIDTNPYLDT